MLYLSNLSWIIGSTTLLVMVSFISIGFYFVYISNKFKIKLLFVMGISLFFAGISYLGIVVDFFTIIFTNNNVDNITLAFLIWPFVPIAFLSGFIISSKILTPKKKWYLLTFILVIVVIFELVIFLDPFGNVLFIEPNLPGEELIEDSLISGSPAGLIGTLMSLTGIVFNGFGLMFKSTRFKDVIRKKYLYMSLGYIILNFSAMLDFLGIAEIVSFIRIISLSSAGFFYLGLRREPEKLIKRLEITEEEISFHLERKICVVCKGDVSRVNYMCPKCNTLYCVNCSEALSNLENMCWVCDEPFDDAKPVRPYKEGETEADLKISKKD